MPVIADKAPENSAHVRFLNFRVCEERDTRDFVMLMETCHNEPHKGWPDAPRTSYRYRICVPDER